MGAVVFHEDLNVERLTGYLLDQKWHDRCEILTNYSPPRAAPNYTPIVVVRFTIGDEKPVFLRHSAGPKQGFFWDSFGSDFQNPELAVLALSRAPTPPVFVRGLYKIPEGFVCSGSGVS